jgi:hypothetical protein
MRLACAAALLIALANAAAAAPSAAYGHERIAIAWTDSDSNVRVDVISLSAKWPGAGMVIGTGAEPRVVAIADVFLVVWMQKSSMVGTRVTVNGVVLDPSPLKIADTVKAFFSVGSTGMEALAAWGTETELRTAVITPAGAVIPAVEPLGRFQYGGGSDAIAWDGTRYLVSWGYKTTPCSFRCFPMPPGEVFWSLLDQSGRPVSAPLHPVLSASAIAGGDGTFLIVGAAAGYSTAFARVLSSNEIDGPHVMDARELRPLHAVWSGTWFNVVAANRVLRVAADGTVIDPDDRYSIPMGWIYDFLSTPAGLVAVSEVPATKHPWLEFVRPWPKRRAIQPR